MNSKRSFALISSTLVAALLMGSAMSRGSNLPMTDLVLFGKVYTKADHQQITGNLPGAITVKINNATAPADLVFASANTLLDVSGQSEGLAQFYVIRLRRFNAGTTRGPEDAFVLPGDRIRIFLAGVEVIETESVNLLVTDAPQDIRPLSLNSAPNPDSDGDGIPDDWEMQYFETLVHGADTDLNKDGVSLFMAYALGLNPNLNNASRMPFMSREADDELVFFFRQSTAETGLQYVVEAQNALNPSSWSPLSGITPVLVTIEGDSRILKVSIPGGVDRPSRFFRLAVSPDFP